MIILMSLPRVTLTATHVLLGALLVGGCATRDPVPRPLWHGRVAFVDIRYIADKPFPPLDGARPLTIFQLNDRRTGEDRDDPYRVGGIRDALINVEQQRLRNHTPYQWILVRALADGFRARGVQVMSQEGREFSPETALTTPCALAGEVRQFTSEASQSGVAAQIEATLRLSCGTDGLPAERTLATRVDGPSRWTFPRLNATLEQILIRALEEFVRDAVLDAELTRPLVRQ
jgi:hypothetical protein